MVNDIAGMALAAEKAGARAVSLVNTFKGMVIDIESRRPVLGNVTGGLSGPAIRPIAVAAVWAAYEAVSIPIIGIGGVSCFRDAVEFMLAGATAVGVGMYNFVNPLVMREVRRDWRDTARTTGLPRSARLSGKRTERNHFLSVPLVSVALMRERVLCVLCDSPNKGHNTHDTEPDGSGDEGEGVDIRAEEPGQRRVIT
jgi:hypothetical protein